MLFFVFEGIDGSGKSTQLELFKQFVEEKLKRPTFYLRDPGATEASTAIRRILLDPKLPLTPLGQTLLFTAARCEACQLIKELDPSTIILADRWVWSTLAYQSEMGSVSPDLIKDLHLQYCREPEPTMCFLIDCDPAIAGQRKIDACQKANMPRDRFELKPLEWRMELRSAYERVAGRYYDWLPMMYKIDGEKPADVVAAYVRSAATQGSNEFAQALAQLSL
jgi:dTMP kinase